MDESGNKVHLSTEVCLQRTCLSPVSGISSMVLMSSTLLLRCWSMIMAFDLC